MPVVLYFVRAIPLPFPYSEKPPPGTQPDVARSILKQYFLVFWARVGKQGLATNISEGIKLLQFWIQDLQPPACQYPDIARGIFQQRIGPLGFQLTISFPVITVIFEMISVVPDQSIESSEPHKALPVLEDIENDVDVLPFAEQEVVEVEGLRLGMRIKGAKKAEGTEGQKKGGDMLTKGPQVRGL